MKYAVRMELDGQEFEVKLGMKAIITLEDKGISLDDLNDVSMKDILTILHIGIKRSNSKISFDEFVDLVDDSDKTIEDLGEVMEKALDLGIGKGKMKLNGDSPKNDFSGIDKIEIDPNDPDNNDGETSKNV